MADHMNDAAAAFHAVSNMEIETGAIRDLAIAIAMAAAGLSEVDPEEGTEALIRLGRMVAEQVGYLETSRAEVFHLLYPYVHPGMAVQS